MGLGSGLMAGVKVLVVDDSRFFREMFATELVKYLPPGSVIEKASDAYEARKYMRTFMPHVILLDVQLPGTNGIVFLENELKGSSFPVVAISSKESYRQEAMAAGAADFMLKPVGMFSPKRDFYGALAKRLLAAAGTVHTYADKQNRSWCQLIAIGSSTGGTEALTKLLTSLRPPLPPICIVQHITPAFSKMFAQRLDSECVLNVKEGASGDILQDNSVYVAPGNKHMRVTHAMDGYKLICEAGPRIHGVLSSADILLESVSHVVKDKSIGIILTGMGADGAEGLLKMRNAGARTLGQDEVSCVVYGMPKVAFSIGAVERQVSIDDMAQALTGLVLRK